MPGGTQGRTAPSGTVGRGRPETHAHAALHALQTLGDRESQYESAHMIEEPMFVKVYADLRGSLTDAVQSFAEEVRDGVYPGPQHTYN